MGRLCFIEESVINAIDDTFGVKSAHKLYTYVPYRYAIRQFGLYGSWSIFPTGWVGVYFYIKLFGRFFIILKLLRCVIPAVYSEIYMQKIHSIHIFIDG